jgi:leucyl aminopeptidase
MRIEFASPTALSAAGAVAVLVYEGGVLSDAAARIDSQTDGALTRAIAATGFTGTKSRSLDVVAPRGVDWSRVVLVGAGQRGAFDTAAAETAAAETYRGLKASGAKALTLCFDETSAAQAANAALGVKLAAYRFDRYRTAEKPDRKPSVETLTVSVVDPKAAEDFAGLGVVADAVCFARDLVSEPPNVLYPAEFARRVKALERPGLTVEILGEAEMTDLGMGALLGVGQGSRRESQLAVIQWKGAADPDAQPIAFVGKGVCFDTGGISLKSPEGMEDMKGDMGGAAAVAGALYALAARKAKVNVVGILGLVENMPDGNAQRPGDIVTAMSGKTIEVNNTDAEGRLVLADALWYCQQRFKPKIMIDLATLTGAVVVALGEHMGAMYCNNEDLAGKLAAASEASRDALWRMPLPASYEKLIESQFADLKNSPGRMGGSITAALFLQHFVNDVAWAHLDIAGTAFMKSSPLATNPEWATGFGVRLLNQLAADAYED